MPTGRAGTGPFFGQLAFTGVSTLSENMDLSLPSRPVNGYADRWTPIATSRILTEMFYQYTELFKVRLMAMVLVTTAAGYLLAAGSPLHWTGLGLTLLGTGFAAGGTAALNQLLEIERDAKMRRTCHRPLPSGRISRSQALVLGVGMAMVGLGILNEFVNPLTAAIGVANVAIYLAVYTPLKTRSALNTLIGAICGAMPPVMGWTGTAGHVGLGAVLLAVVLFFWQIPHFLSLAWLYRDDYAGAGYRMLPVIDPTGRLTCLMIVVYSLALLPLGLVLTLCGVAGYLFGAVSLLLGFGLFVWPFSYACRRPARTPGACSWPASSICRCCWCSSWRTDVRANIAGVQRPNGACTSFIDGASPE